MHGLLVAGRPGGVRDRGLPSGEKPRSSCPPVCPRISPAFFGVENFRRSTANHARGSTCTRRRNHGRFWPPGGRCCLPSKRGHKPQWYGRHGWPQVFAGGRAAGIAVGSGGANPRFSDDRRRAEIGKRAGPLCETSGRSGTGRPGSAGRRQVSGTGDPGGSKTPADVRPVNVWFS